MLIVYMTITAMKVVKCDYQKGENFETIIPFIIKMVKMHS